MIVPLLKGRGTGGLPHDNGIRLEEIAVFGRFWRKTGIGSFFEK
jgi:hypothetical protein